MSDLYQGGPEFIPPAKQIPTNAAEVDALVAAEVANIDQDLESLQQEIDTAQLAIVRGLEYDRTYTESTNRASRARRVGLRSFVASVVAGYGAVIFEVPDKPVIGFAVGGVMAFSAAVGIRAHGYEDKATRNHNAAKHAAAIVLNANDRGILKGIPGWIVRVSDREEGQHQE